MNNWKVRLLARLGFLTVVMILPMACSLTNDDNQPPTPVPTVYIPPTPLIITATPAVTITPFVQPTAIPTTGSQLPCVIPSGWVAYQVVSGDTLSNIGQRTGSTATQLATGNCLPNANSIYVGQLLYVPRSPAPLPTATNAPVVCSPTPRLTIGGQGRITPDSANAVRSAPGTGSNSVVTGQIPGSGVFLVLAGPQCANGIYWWQVNYNGLIGWTGEGQGSAYWVEPVSTQSCSPSPRLIVGLQGRVLPGAPNTLRSAAGTGSNSVVIGQIPGEGIFAVLSGPACTGGIHWWQVNYNGQIGWTGEGQGASYWVEPYTIGICNPAPRLTVSGQGRVLSGVTLQVRDQPSTTGYVFGSISAGELFSVIGGPQCNQGMYWWQISSSGTYAGWIAEGQVSTYWVEPYSSVACTLPPRLTIGYAGRVTPGVANTLRSAPGSGSTAIGEIPAGGIFRVAGPAQCAAGINYWQVNYNGVTGYTGEGQNSTYWLEPVTCPASLASRLVPNSTARVTPGTPNRLRSAAGSSSTVIGEIPGGASFTTIGSPACGPEGWLWWQVNYNGQIGWTAEGDSSSFWLEPM